MNADLFKEKLNYIHKILVQANGSWQNGMKITTIPEQLTKREMKRMTLNWSTELSVLLHISGQSPWRARETLIGLIHPSKTWKSPEASLWLWLMVKQIRQHSSLDLLISYCFEIYDLLSLLSWYPQFYSELIQFNFNFFHTNVSVFISIWLWSVSHCSLQSLWYVKIYEPIYRFSREESISSEDSWIQAAFLQRIPISSVVNICISLFNKSLCFSDLSLTSYWLPSLPVIAVFWTEITSSAVPIVWVISCSLLQIFNSLKNQCGWYYFCLVFLFVCCFEESFELTLRYHRKEDSSLFL